jgi:hypothetical protein
MDWLFEANRDAERRFPWILIPGVASIVYWVKSLFGMTCGTTLFTRNPNLVGEEYLHRYMKYFDA